MTVAIPIESVEEATPEARSVVEAQDVNNPGIVDRLRNGVAAFFEKHPTLKGVATTSAMIAIMNNPIVQSVLGRSAAFVLPVLRGVINNVLETPNKSRNIIKDPGEIGVNTTNIDDLRNSNSDSGVDITHQSVSETVNFEQVKPEGPFGPLAEF
jgi:hypothetical protein